MTESLTNCIFAITISVVFGANIALFIMSEQRLEVRALKISYEKLIKDLK